MERRSGEDLGDVKVHGVTGGQSTEKRERDKIIVRSYYLRHKQKKRSQKKKKKGKKE